MGDGERGDSMIDRGLHGRCHSFKNIAVCAAWPPCASGVLIGSAVVFLLPISHCNTKKRMVLSFMRFHAFQRASRMLVVTNECMRAMGAFCVSHN